MRWAEVLDYPRDHSCNFPLLPPSAVAFVVGMIPQSELQAIEEFVAGFGTSVASEASPLHPAGQPDSDSRGPRPDYELNAPSSPAPSAGPARVTTNPQNSRDLRPPLLL